MPPRWESDSLLPRQGEKQPQRHEPSFRIILKSWFFTFSLYLIGYTFLFGFLIALVSLHQRGMLDANIPTWTGRQSVHRGEPGLSIVPVIDSKDSLMTISIGRPETYLPYNDAMYAFLQAYEYLADMGDGFLRDCETQTNQTLHSIQGHTDHGLVVDPHSSCQFDLTWAYRCNINRNYGYDDSTPCFLLTLNRIHGWQPSPKRGPPQVCCGGLTPNDEELLGTLCYYDALVHDEDGCERKCGTFPQWYFPFVNQGNYQAPLVFLEIRNPRKNVLIMLKCELENVGYDSPPIRFALLLD